MQPEVGRLAAFVRERVEPFDGALALRRIEGGQSNPTWIVDAGARRYVPRSKPAGVLLPSAHAVEREFRVMLGLAGSAVPVPRVHALCEDTGVLGSAFSLMDFVEGRILTDQTLPGMAPAERAAHYAELARVLAALHAVDHRSAGLTDFGREGRCVERQIAEHPGRGGADRQLLPGRRPRRGHRALAFLPGLQHVPPGRVQQSVARRALLGNAASSRARAVAGRLAATAAAGWAMARRAAPALPR